MELEGLKDIWKSYAESSLLQESVEKGRFVEMIKANSGSAVSKLKRNVLLEVSLVFVCFMVYIFISFLHPLREIRLFYGFFTALCIPYFIYFFIKYRQLLLFYPDQDLKSNLEMTIYRLEKFLKLYFLSYIILVPFAIFFGTIAGIELQSGEELLTDFNWSDPGKRAIFLIVISITAISSALNYPFTKWYIRKLYGVHLQKLKVCLNELNEIN